MNPSNLWLFPSFKTLFQHILSYILKHLTQEWRDNENNLSREDVTCVCVCVLIMGESWILGLGHVCDCRHVPFRVLNVGLGWVGLTYPSC